MKKGKEVTYSFYIDNGKRRLYVAPNQDLYPFIFKSTKYTSFHEGLKEVKKLSKVKKKLELGYELGYVVTITEYEFRKCIE